MSDYFINTDSDSVALDLLHFLDSEGYKVYDPYLVNESKIIVFNTSLNALKSSIREAKSWGVLGAGPYHIKIYMINKRALLSESSDEKHVSRSRMKD